MEVYTHTNIYYNYVNIVNIVNDETKRRGLPEIVHIIPLGHEIDRAVKPFTKTTADRAYVLAIPRDADFDPEMVQKQHYFVEQVTKQLEAFGIRVRMVPVNMFNILEVMTVISRIIKVEKEAGNTVRVNMSSCGRKTSVAVTLAAMVYDVEIYYVSADRYATGGDSTEELEHGLSIVTDVRTEMFHNFRIKIPEDDEMKLLVELKKRKEKKEETGSDVIIKFLHDLGVYGFETLPPIESPNIDYSIVRKKDKKDEEIYIAGKMRRALLNRINRSFLKKLEDLGYVERTWRGKSFYVRITQAGEYIAAVSGEFECFDSSSNKI